MLKNLACAIGLLLIALTMTHHTVPVLVEGLSPISIGRHTWRFIVSTCT